jgi:hypothetical protein
MCHGGGGGQGVKAGERGEAGAESFLEGDCCRFGVAERWALITVQRAPERLQMRAVNCHKGGPSLLPLLSVALCALLPRVPFCASPSRSLCRFLAL